MAYTHVVIGKPMWPSVDMRHIWPP